MKSLGLTRVTWPDCGGEISSTVLLLTAPDLNPRMQVPLAIFIAHSTVSDLSWNPGALEKMHDSADADPPKSSNSARVMTLEDHIGHHSPLPTVKLTNPTS